MYDKIFVLVVEIFINLITILYILFFYFLVLFLHFYLRYSGVTKNYKGKTCIGMAARKTSEWLMIDHGIEVRVRCGRWKKAGI